VFCHVDSTFADRAIKRGGGFIVGRENYGQGSSREHAALAPKFLGVKAVVATSFDRIHLANLVNFGIVPLIFENKKDYDSVAQGDALHLVTKELVNKMCLENSTKKTEISVLMTLSHRDRETIRAGGKLAAVRKKHAESRK
jgi:aconitate hydratase